MKQEFITYKKEKSPCPKRAFEIIVLAFLVFTFSCFLVLMNVEKIEPTIENGEEIAAVFKESAFGEFLGFENTAKEEEKEEIVKEYILKNGELNVFKYYFSIGD